MNATLKNYMIAGFLLLAFTQCDTNRVFYPDDSENIRYCNSIVAAFYEQDWDTYRSKFAEGAWFKHNQWEDADIKVDDIIAVHKINHQHFLLTRGKDEEWLEWSNKEGKRYVELWGEIVATNRYNPGDVRRVPLNVSFVIGEDGRSVIGEYVLIDTEQLRLSGGIAEERKSIHFMDIKQLSEADVLAYFEGLNQVIHRLGYPDIRYRILKVKNPIATQSYQYVLESTWPNDLVYQRIHEHPDYQAWADKHEAMIDQLFNGEVYRKVYRLN